MALTILWLGLSTGAFVFGLALTWWLHQHHQIGAVIPLTSAIASCPLISIIVPARNEARNIRRCVVGLLAQTYPQLELIVVDDRSTDETPLILAELARGDSRLTVIPSVPLPRGWVGKPHALTQGAEAAQGEWLCFVDADTFATPDLLASTYAAAQIHQADLFTILTAQELGSFWEKVVMPIVFTALAVGFPSQQVNDPQRPEAVANGQFILIRRAVYQTVGGHRALYNSIAEDKALAEQIKRRGYRLVFGDGRAFARTRMYTSFAELWEGWTKNIYLGMRDRLGLLLFGAFASLAAALFLPGWLALGVIWLGAGGGGPAAIVLLQSLITWASVLFCRAQVTRSFGLSGGYAVTLPLGALIFGAMMFTSAFKVLSGRGVTWKGRTYADY